MKFEVTILGSGSAVPTLRRNPSAHVVNVNEHYMLLDCAEGTQMQIRRFGISLLRIDQIFITHLHGDHFLGLPGLLQTIHLLGRSKAIEIYGPPELESILSHQFTLSNSTPRFPIIFKATQAKEREKIYENKLYEVYSLPLKHKVATTGFLIKERPKLRNIIISALAEYRIPVYWLSRIKEGQDYVQEDGKVVPNKEITLPPAPSKSYAYCTDTAYYPPLVDQIKGVDLLYHEASFTQLHVSRAHETLHSTASEAAQIAHQAGVKKLVIGHFSARYRDVAPFLEEARPIFEATSAAEDGLIIQL